MMTWAMGHHRRMPHIRVGCIVWTGSFKEAHGGLLLNRKEVRRQDKGVFQLHHLESPGYISVCR